MPGYTTRETFTSPRSSGDRVVPISKETYVNGQLVDRKGSAYDSGNSSDRHHHRRSTYDVDPRTSSSGSNSNYLRPSVVHHDRDVSPGKTPTFIYPLPVLEWLPGMHIPQRLFSVVLIDQR